MTKIAQDEIASSTTYRFRLRDFLLGAQMLFVLKDTASRLKGIL